MSEAWSQWQGQVIDGKFHLKQYLGGSGQSAVFLAHLYPARANDGSSSEAVAIRLIADSANAELQLSRWRMAQSLSHPHLIQILDTGRCRLGEIDLIFAVMEYGEENLSQIVPQRALTAQEAREMLEPTLDALAYLHARGLVHGHVKPVNITAVGETLKLASDGICPADEPVSGRGMADALATTNPDSLSARRPDIYHAPETIGGIWSPAGDIWSLGMTLAEVLTQRLPSEDGLADEQADPLLPENLPAQFVEIVRGCLRRDLRLRWTMSAIKARLHTVSAAQPSPARIERLPAAAVDMASVGSLGTAVGIEGGCPPETRQDQGLSRLASQEALASSAGDQCGPLMAGTAVTFAEALRRKPVVSEKATTTQAPMALAATAGVTVPGSRGLQVSPDRGRLSTQADVETSSDTIALAPEQADGIADLIKSARAQRAELLRREIRSSVYAPNQTSQESKNRTLDFLTSTKAGALATALAMRTALAKFVSRIAPVFQRTTSQAVEAAQHYAAQHYAAQTRRAIRELISKTEARLGPYPGQTIIRLAVAVLLVAAALAGAFSGIEMLRHKSSHAAKHEITTAPANVAAVRPERRVSPKKRSSVAQGKPRPGSALPSQTNAQAAAQPTGSQAPPPNNQPSSPQSNTQVPASKAEARPVTPPVVSSQSSVRHIDDGGAEDESANQNNARGSGNGRSGTAEAAGTNLGIAQEVLPQVSRSALHTIHGTVRVSVKVRVDRSGNVAGAELASAGPSRYFARKSLEAAQSWRFAPGQGSPLLVHFEFRNNGARAFATRAGS